MCGVCGIFRFDKKKVRAESVQSMLSVMKHRGPDDEGVFVADNVGMGFVRLSILDLSPAGHQPMFSSDKRYVMVFNGEIYNYIELRDELKALGHSFKTQTDTEVLLAAYQEWGKECLHRFNGMWVFAIYDNKEKKLFAARDRFGIKPFYYCANREGFTFCSEIKPLLLLHPFAKIPDQQSLFDFLVFNRTDQTERTFFERIKKLSHGHCLHLDLKQTNPVLNIEQWYDLRRAVSGAEPFGDSDSFRELFYDSLKLRLRSDVPVGVCLSGGLDSSSIVSSLFREFKKTDLNTFSAVYQPGDYGDETPYIKLYEHEAGRRFYTYPTAQTLHDDLEDFVRTHEEPMASTGPYAQYKVMELAQKHVVVTLDGQGADEILAGYHYFFGFFFKDLLRKLRLGKLTAESLHYLLKHRSLYGFKSFFYFMMPASVRTSVRVKEKGYINPDFVKKYCHTNAIADSLYGAETLTDALLDHFEYKLEHLLKWEDRNSMRFSIEARVPFLDYRLVERTLATSSDLIIRHGMTKNILRESMKGLLPEQTRTRRDKIGFDTPQDEWFRSPYWQQKIEQVLASTEFRNKNLINCDEAVRVYQNHLAKKGNFGKEIWKWLHLDEWFRQFID